MSTPPRRRGARQAPTTTTTSSCPGAAVPAWQFTEKFEVDPWKIEITGLCNKPGTLDLDDLFAFPHEERYYHFRCVERWAMNVPWSGFPLRTLIDQRRAQGGGEVRPLRDRRMRPAQMPGIKEAHWYPWPYNEALRLDEARNELALVATGVYGEPLLKQHGAPVRLIVPWKYGYKNPKSIVKIEFVAERALDLLADPAPRVRLPVEREPLHPPSALEPGPLLLAAQP